MASNPHSYPHLAAVENLVCNRPVWWGQEPIAVLPDLFAEAEAEMATVMRERGLPVPRDKSYKNENFRMFGVTVLKAIDG